jgi:hypothetical protein
MPRSGGAFALVDARAAPSHREQNFRMRQSSAMRNVVDGGGESSAQLRRATSRLAQAPRADEPSESTIHYASDYAPTQGKLRPGITADG